MVAVLLLHQLQEERLDGFDDRLFLCERAVLDHLLKDAATVMLVNHAIVAVFNKLNALFDEFLLCRRGCRRFSTLGRLAFQVLLLHEQFVVVDAKLLNELRNLMLLTAHKCLGLTGELSSLLLARGSLFIIIVVATLLGDTLTFVVLVELAWSTVAAGAHSTLLSNASRLLVFAAFLIVSRVEIDDTRLLLDVLLLLGRLQERRLALCFSFSSVHVCKYINNNFIF